ncbi:MAG: hypothetical protein WCO79_00040 [bacterium]
MKNTKKISLYGFFAAFASSLVYLNIELENSYKVSSQPNSDLAYAIPLSGIYIIGAIIFIIFLISAIIQYKSAKDSSKIKYYSPFIIILVMACILRIATGYFFPLSHHKVTNVSGCALYANPAIANTCRAKLICGSYPGKANEETWLKCNGDIVLGIE